MLVSRGHIMTLAASPRHGHRYAIPRRPLRAATTAQVETERRRCSKPAHTLRLALTMVVAVTWLLTNVASAAAVKQGGLCDAFAGATPLGGQYSDASVTVPACGPRPYNGGPQTRVYPYKGAPRFTDGYQCVEFSERFIYYKFGLGAPNISTNGDQIVGHYAAAYPGKFVVEDASQTTAPAQGDVLSFSDVSTFASSSGGHTAVVQASNVDGSGNGSITIIEENSSPGGSRTLQVRGWQIKSSEPYVKWLHYKSAPLPPPGPGPTARALDLVFAIDTTGSMSPYIASVVQASSRIVDNLDAAHTDYRIGIVDYKDSDYGCPDYDAATDLPFSISRTDIESALASLEAKVYPGSGCDVPEDVYSGISLALRFPWRAGVTKAVMIMGDAPGHDPEPHSGLTLSAIQAQAAAVDPAQVYPILIGTDTTAHDFDQSVAAATGGQTFDATSDPSLAGVTFVKAIEAVLKTLQPTTTALSMSPQRLAPGAPVRLVATVTPGTATGWVAFRANGHTLLDCQALPLDSKGQATCSTTFGSAGTFAIDAVYSGNDGLAYSTSNPLSLRVAGRTVISITRVKVLGRSLAVTLACHVAKPATCHALVMLRSTERVKGRTIIGIGARATRRTQVVILADRTVTFRAGKKTTVKLRLGAVGRRLLTRFHVLPAQATVALRTVPKPTTIFARRVAFR